MSGQVKPPPAIFDKILWGILNFLGSVTGLMKTLAVFAIFLAIVGYIIVIAREEFRVPYFFEPRAVDQLQGQD